MREFKGQLILILIKQIVIELDSTNQQDYEISSYYTLVA